MIRIANDEADAAMTEQGQLFGHFCAAFTIVRVNAVKVVLMLGWGDLLVMGGSCQRTWQHSIPKVAHALPRMAVMFRPTWYAKQIRRYRGFDR